MGHREADEPAAGAGVRKRRASATCTGRFLVECMTHSRIALQDEDLSWVFNLPTDFATVLDADRVPAWPK